MWKIIIPLSFIALAICHNHLTFTLSLTLIEISLVNVLIGADHFAASMWQSILEHAFVIRATLGCHLSLTMSLVALEFALVYITIS